MYLDENLVGGQITKTEKIKMGIIKEENDKKQSNQKIQEEVK